ncbi:putative transmembrane protein [uncultured Candidatus Thioglobus sp.]|nr:putative transmembrane protein [uncultured Candidatus Thioglobus sp.]SMM98327.1 putative transmembrane protein [uncultured Candidatus Thioglobus sp.]
MNSKKELWVLLASFVLPIVLGTAFFYWNPTAFTGNTVNYGEFVNPIITTEEQDIVFSKETRGSLQGLWTLAYVTNRCDNACQSTLKDIKTIRILMNEDMRRIQRMLLINGATDVQEYGVLIANPSIKLQRQLSKFPNNSLFLIDPLGNIMLHYDARTLVIKRVLKDLKRLFKYSRIG